MDQEKEYVEFEDNEEKTMVMAIQQEFKSAPWYVSSIAIHSLIFLLMLLLPIEPPSQKQRRIIIQSDIIEEVKKIEEPEVDIQENDPEVVTDDTKVEPCPVVITTDFQISDHNETNDEVEDNTARGDPDSISTFDEIVGSPALMGVGSSGGKGGGGRFGTRTGGGKDNLVKIGGGSKKTESSVDWALQWLAEHQEPDGHWDCAKYGGGNHNVAVSSMALLAFLGAGNSNKFGKYRKTVASGTYWLVQQQNANGSIGPHRYEAGIALMAISEAFGMGDTSVKDSAQKAVNWAAASQCPTGGWDYSPKSIRVDTSVTGWWVMGIKSAKTAGLTVPYEVIEKALKYIQQATTDPVGDNGYGGTSTCSYSSNTEDVKQVKRGGGSGRLTAVALTCLQFLGRPRTDPQVLSTANKVISDGFPTADKSDFYRWYYSCLGLFQMGVRSEYWRKWNDPLKNTLLATQVKEGTFKENKGSWNYETEAHGKSWGRVGQTALGALMLEVYYRYYDVHTSKKTKP